MSKLETDRIINSLAEGQLGLVSRRQLRERLTSGVIRRRIDGGSLVPMSARVLRAASTTLTPEVRVMAGVLDVGDDAVASHTTAAALTGFPGFVLEPIHVTGVRPRVRHAEDYLSTSHQPRRLAKAHLSEVRGIPVTTPTRTLFDLANDKKIHPRRLERALDNAWASGVVSYASLRRVLGDVACRGRTGVVLMRQLIEDRGPDHCPPGSGLESRFQELARKGGFGSFVRQVDLGAEEGWIGRVDFLDRDNGLVVEVDSRRFHTSKSDRSRDERRHSALRAAGWRVVSVTDHDLFHDPTAVINRLKGRTSIR
ncbi:MAG: DUF559 domain-containing protein [Acidimicrobiaceae bacterium]|nr:DUF559 domain-containing protein [Acidimicrobiia bacterium]MCY4495336.1 DUF559 domain-containing protein [Acidimicrobiaceae bacterium]